MRTWRASTARFLPDATVNGEVPAYFARLGVGVSVRVVPELTEQPGAEHDTESWLGEVDVGVRVCLKMGGQRGFELADLVVQLGDDADGGAGGGRERRGDRRGCGQLFGAQRGPDFAGAGGDIALPATAFERGLDRGQVSRAPCSGLGARPSTPRASPWARSSKATRAAG